MRPLIVSGSAHPALGEELARELECELASCLLRSFPDGEQDVEIQTSVREQGGGRGPRQAARRNG